MRRHQRSLSGAAHSAAEQDFPAGLKQARQLHPRTHGDPLPGDQVSAAFRSLGDRK